MSEEISNKSRRVARVERSLKEILAGYFIEITPFFEGALVSVIRVSASSDLRQALVFVSVFNGDETNVFDALEEKRASMQHRISKELPMKFCPKLKFILDGSIDRMVHVGEVLNRK